ncbi:MAG: adenosylcobinamide-GDP ribazoletransferase [Pseudomonadota bacterium]
MTRADSQGVLFLSAVQFLTRLPVPEHPWSPGQLARASRYFPLVGALVGGLSALVWLGASALLPAPLAAGLTLAASIALTGALHEDGLADTVDALGGHAARDRALEIMRDSRIGTYGALALILSVGLRWAALAALAPLAGAAALITAATLGRAAMVPVSRLLPYARGEGAGQQIAPGPNGLDLAIALATALVALGLLLLVAVPPSGLLILVTVSPLAAALPFRAAARRLGGYTGDVLGAIGQAVEIAVLVTVAGLLAGPS